jgi:hypothetical protein
VNSRLACQAVIPPSIFQRSQPKNIHRFDSRVSISGRLARNPRPDQDTTPPSSAYPASDPLISRQFSSPTPLAQALHHPPVHWHALRRDLARQLPNRNLTSCPAPLDTSKSVSTPAISASDSQLLTLIQTPCTLSLPRKVWSQF